MLPEKLKKPFFSIYLVFSLVIIGFMGLLVFEGVVDDYGVKAATIIVDAGGHGDYTKISNAVSAAKDGDVIHIWDGIYQEIMTINKKVTIIGNGTDNTTIKGYGNFGNVLTVQSNWFNISNLTITNSGTGWNDAGIKIDGVHNCSIININCSNNSFKGLYLDNANNTVIKNCYFNSNSLYLENSNLNEITYNIFEQWGDVELYFSNNNFIRNNDFKNRSGMDLDHSDWNLVLQNNFNKNSSGILVIDADFNRIINNTILSSGINIASATNNLVEGNILKNKYYGIFSQHSYNNTIKNNSIEGPNLGVYLLNSHSTIIQNNVLELCGLFYHENPYTYWQTHNITQNNTVNGKPIYFWKYVNNSCIPPNAGQVFLFDCSNIVFENQNLSDCTIGAQIEHSDNIKILNNTINTDYITGLKVQYSDNLEIINNSISKTYNGIEINYSDNNVIELNHINNNNRDAIYSYESNQNIFLKNNCSNNNGRGLFNLMCYDLTIDNNICNWNSNGIYFGSGYNNVNPTKLTNNTCNFNKNYGLMINRVLSPAAAPVICYNNTCNFNKWSGIRLGNLDSNIISNNICLFNNQSGINSYYSDNNNINNNTILSSTTYGFDFYRSLYNSITNNNISKNKIGLRFLGAAPLGSSGNSIFRNNISFNTDIGFSLDSYSKNNMIYQNNFLFNNVQAVDAGVNYWNDSYFQGNYWSNYLGVDDGSDGRIKGDGIGDTNLPHLGLDYYPFVRTSGWLFPTRPTLKTVNNIVTSDHYTLSWNQTWRTTCYILEEDNQIAFSSPTIIFNGPELSFNIKNKSNGTYYYRVCSYNNDHKSDWSNIINITVDWEPQTPTGLIVENVTGHNVTLAWISNQEPDIIEYKIFMNDSDSGSTGPFYLIQSVPKDINRSIINGLVEEITYHFIITACDKYSNSSYSNPVSVTTLDVTRPAKPKLFEAEAINDTQIRLTWSPNTEPDLMGYTIYMNSTKLGESKEFEPLITVEPSVVSVMITGLTEQMTYYFKLKAFDEVPNYSVFSDTAFATTPDTNPPTKPTGLVVSHPTYDSLTLSWNLNPEKDINEYIIFRGPSEQEVLSKIASVSAGFSTYIDKGLEENTVYYYKLQAVDDAQLLSQFSEIAIGKTMQRPYPPEINNTIADFELKEDTRDELSINLYYWFRDPNNDQMVFRVEGGNHFIITIFQGNGTVILVPEKNWNGQETFTFYANDSIFEIFDEITITVTPVNDPPEQPKILIPELDSQFTVNDAINFSGTCNDPDLLYGDKLTFKWSSNIDGSLGTGENLTGIKLSFGAHKITLEVLDTKGARASTYINIIVAGVPDGNGKDGEGDGTNAFEMLSIAIVIIIVIIIIILVVIFFIIKRKQPPKPEEIDKSPPKQETQTPLDAQELNVQYQQESNHYYQQQTTQAPKQQPQQISEIEQTQAMTVAQQNSQTQNSPDIQATQTDEVLYEDKKQINEIETKL